MRCRFAPEPRYAEMAETDAMTIEISSEAYRILQRRVDEGEYGSVEEALDGSVHDADALNRDLPSPEYLSYAKSRIEAGFADAAAGRVVPADEVFARLNARAAR